MQAPEIPVKVDPLGGVMIVYMVIGDNGWLARREMLVSGGIDGWKNAREILDDPDTIGWRAVHS